MSNKTLKELDKLLENYDNETQQKQFLCYFFGSMSAVYFAAHKQIFACIACAVMSSLMADKIGLKRLLFLRTVQAKMAMTLLEVNQSVCTANAHDSE